MWVTYLKMFVMYLVASRLVGETLGDCLVPDLKNMTERQTDMDIPILGVLCSHYSMKSSLSFLIEWLRENCVPET
jgi:hypothetical protein